MEYKIIFRELISENSKQLHEWLQLYHVREFWDDGHRAIQQVIAYYFITDDVKRFIFYINDEPAGFIQSYKIDQSHPYYQFTLPNQKTIGVDYFIGNTKYLGHRLAGKILNDFIKQNCQDADRILVDPDPNNTKAIQVYSKCGFVKVSTCIIENKKLQIMLAIPENRFQIRELQQQDLVNLNEYFGVNTPYKNSLDKWKLYFSQQQTGERIVRVIEYKNHVIGIGTLKLNSDYPGFKENKIPEINDVLIATAFWKQGFGWRLIVSLENAAKKANYKVIGLGVGLYQDYGKAQRLYVKMGYVPDGNGIAYNNKPAIPGVKYPVDDELILYLTKSLE